MTWYLLVIHKLYRARAAALARALNPLIVGIKRNIGPTELLGLVSLAIFAWGVGLMWFPLAPVVIGSAGMAVAVINARMRK